MAVHVLHHSGVLVVTVFEGSDPSSLGHLGDVLDLVADVEPVVVDASELALGSIDRITVLIALLNALTAPAARRTWVVPPCDPLAAPPARRRRRRADDALHRVRHCSSGPPPGRHHARLSTGGRNRFECSSVCSTAGALLA